MELWTHPGSSYSHSQTQRTALTGSVLSRASNQPALWFKNITSLQIKHMGSSCVMVSILVLFCNISSTCCQCEKECFLLLVWLWNDISIHSFVNAIRWMTTNPEMYDLEPFQPAVLLVRLAIPLSCLQMATVNITFTIIQQQGRIKKG